MNYIINLTIEAQHDLCGISYDLPSVQDTVGQLERLEKGIAFRV